MKKVLMVLWAVFISLALSAGGYDAFLRNESEALKKAEAENKVVFALFTGSNWCRSCIVLEKNVLDNEEFVKVLDKDFVLLLFDFPNNQKLTEAEVKQNEQLLKKYEIEKYPTIVLIAPDGKILQKMQGIHNQNLKSFLMWFNHESSKTMYDYKQYLTIKNGK